jgi:hypothetical protein
MNPHPHPHRILKTVLLGIKLSTYLIDGLLEAKFEVESSFKEKYRFFSVKSK